MKTKALLSLMLSLVLTFTLPAAVSAQEVAAAQDTSAEEGVSELSEEGTALATSDEGTVFTASGEDAAQTDDTVEPGVQKEESEEDADKASVSEKVFPCYFYDMDNVFDLTLYFINDVTDMPYINLADWADILVSVYQYYLQDADYGLYVETDGSAAQLSRENGYSLIIDFDECTINVEDYDAFLHTSGDNSLLDMVSSNSTDEKGNPLLFQRINRGSFDRYGKEIAFNLADYDIPLYWSEEDGLYLLPLQTMNDLFLVLPSLSSIFFNGEGVYLGDEDMFGLNEDELTPLGEAYYEAPAGEMSEELARYNYCELCLALDHLYGLKESHDITTFDRIFTETGYRYDLTSTDPNVVDGALNDFIYYYLDDLHSAFVGYSYRTEQMQSFGGAGLASLQSDSDALIYMAARDLADHEIQTYEEVGNTAYVTFDSFGMNKQPAAYYEEPAEPATDPAVDPLDTVDLILYAHEQITRKDSPIENVVIDLSLNGGGAIDAAAFVAAWYLGEGAMSIRNSLTGAVSTGVYMVDTNLDGKYDEKDTVADKNLYCLISPNSFSCGNLLPNILKASHRVTLLGQTTGGGSCSVLPMSTAHGCLFQISSPNHMSFMKNGSYYDTDTGIDPDCLIVKPSNFYDREALTEYINQLF